MSTLHIVASSPFTSNALDTALEYSSKEDSILLIENGVYGASDIPVNERRLATSVPGVSYFVLEEDLRARSPGNVLAQFKSVSYADFVELVCQHKNSVNWS